MFWIYAIAFVSSLLASLLLTPWSMTLARKYGAIDFLDARKIHLYPKPRWGGIGIIGGFFIGLAVLWLLSPTFSKLLTFKAILQENVTLKFAEQLAGILFAIIVLFITGMQDDRRPIPSSLKLAIQIIAAYIAMTYGVRIYGLSLPGFEAYSRFPLWFMQVTTVLWLVGMTNALNLVDGLDGLAGGIAAIVTASFVAVALIQENSFSSFYGHQIRLAGIISSSACGGVVGFLVYNFFPSQVFMGDSGSMSLGFLIGAIAVIGAFKTTMLAVLFIPFLLVAFPVVDMTLAFVRRLINKKNPFLPDRGHLHHKLLDAGWTQREIVFMVYTLTLLLSLVSLVVVSVRIK